MAAEESKPDPNAIEPLRVLQWLLPVVSLLFRAQRASRVARALAAFDLLVALILGVAWLTHLEDPAWVQRLGAAEVPGLGVVVEEVPSGLGVVSVLPGSGASRAGVTSGDVIAAIDDRPVLHREELIETVVARPTGTRYVLNLRRGRRVLRARVVAGTRWVTTAESRARQRTMRGLALVISGAIVLLIAARVWRARAGPAWVLLWAAALPVGPALLDDTLSQLIAMALAALAALVTLRIVPPPEHRMGPRRAMWTTLGVVLAVPTLVIRGVGLVIVVGYLTDTGVVELPPTASIVAAALVAVTAFQSVLVVPVLEEAVFRGLLLPLAARVFRPWTALALTSLAFGFLHVLGGTNNVWVPTALGFAFGYLRLRTGRLLPGILLHVAWNAVTLVL